MTYKTIECHSKSAMSCWPDKDNWSEIDCLSSQHAIIWEVFFYLILLLPINNLSVIKGWVFLGWTSTQLGLMFLLKDTTQWCWWGSNPRPLSLKSSTLPLHSLIIWAATQENLSSGGLRTTQAQISLRMSADWSAPVLSAFWKVSYVTLVQVKFQFSSLSQ